MVFFFFLTNALKPFCVMKVLVKASLFNQKSLFVWECLYPYSGVTWALLGFLNPRAQSVPCGGA